MKDATKKKNWLYISIILPPIIILVIVFFLIPIDPEASTGSSPKPPQMRKLAAKIGRLETELNEKQEELFDLLKAYNQKTGESLAALNSLRLSDDERKILEDKILKEEDLSIKSLLRDILDRDSQISRLKSEMAQYESLLPQSHLVVEGETHYQIAMDFLVNEKKVEEVRALRLVEETMLFEPLRPGFRVWNFYFNDEFATFVTQGSAAISPTELRKAPEKYRGDIENRAKEEEERLTAKIKNLRAVRNQLEFQIKDLTDEKEKMEKNLNELERLVNSLFYMVDLEENLLKKGIIKKGGFLGLGSPKLKKISPEDYDQKIDLRDNDIIEIYANQIKINEIKKVTLYPEFYKKGNDYEVKIEEDKQKAIVSILNTEKFRRDRVVISVE